MTATAPGSSSVVAVLKPVNPNVVRSGHTKVASGRSKSP